MQTQLDELKKFPFILTRLSDPTPSIPLQQFNLSFKNKQNYVQAQRIIGIRRFPHRSVGAETYVRPQSGAGAASEPE